MLQQTVQLGDFTADLRTLIYEAPQYAADLAALVRQAGAYLPQIRQIVTRAGSSLPQVQTIVEKGIGYLPTIVNIVQDPALPQLVQRINTLRRLEQKPATPGQPAPAAVPGVGIQKMLAPIDAFIWYREHPKTAIMIGVGATVALVGAGVLIGRVTKRRS
jgi:hypothetical protein